MKTRLAATLLFAVAVSTGTHSVQAQDTAAAPAPIEAFYCDWQKGKTMKDLMKVAERFTKWADENHTGYSAWILTPRFGQFDDLPEVLWLGSDASGSGLGKGMDAYTQEGEDIQKQFDKVVDCSAHALASSIEVAAPTGPPGDGVVMFTQCNIAEGSDWNKAVDAHKQYAAAMRELGAKNSNWMFFPMLGNSAAADLDYWGVATFANWSDYFDAYELYVNGGGWQKGMEAMNGAASCAQGTASVWDVKLVRQAER